MFASPPFFYISSSHGAGIPPSSFLKIKLTFPSETSYTPNHTFVSGFHFTHALLPGGPALITHPPIWYKPELIKTEKELEDEELKGLLARNLRPSKKKNSKKAGEGEAKAE